MKAIVHHRYGSSDVLELQEVDKPSVKDDQVLIRVHAASVNPYDWHMMTGTLADSPELPRFSSETRGCPPIDRRTNRLPNESQARV